MDAASAFQFCGYKITDVEFKLNPNLKKESEEAVSSLDISVKVEVSEEFQQGFVTITANINENYIEDNNEYFMKLDIVGSFKVINSKIGKNELFNFVKLNGTTALFPFLRSTVCDITKAANCEPLILPLVNIAEFMREKDCKLDSPAELKPKKVRKQKKV